MGKAPASFILNDRDREEVLGPAARLLWKVARSTLLSGHQLEVVAKLIHSLESLPAPLPEETDIEVTVTGPRRCFGEHEIYHFWTIHAEGETGLLEVGAAGHFYRRSTGGDSFTSLQWSAHPGEESQYDDYLHTLSIVDDAAPFAEEVDSIDLATGNYEVDVVVDGEKLPRQDEG